MKLHDLRPAKDSRKKRKRVGRGNAAGQGTYAGRGRKGQGARSGTEVKPWFEGGQTPLVMRLRHLPGFTNIFKIQYRPVNLSRLAGFEAGAVVSPETLAEAGIIHSADEPVVILGQGSLDRPLLVRAHRFSATARAKILEAGGAVEELPVNGERKKRRAESTRPS